MTFPHFFWSASSFLAAHVEVRGNFCAPALFSSFILYPGPHPPHLVTKCCISPCLKHLDIHGIHPLLFPPIFFSNIMGVSG